MRLLIHSLRQVTGNLPDVLRLSVIPFVLTALFAYWAFLSAPPDEAAAQAMIADGTYPWTQTIVSFLVALLAGLWFAVGWHRFVLLQESPRTAMAFRFDRILAYFGRTLQIILILIIPGIILGFAVVIVAAPVAGAFGRLGAVLATVLLIALPIGLLFYRLSPMLPAAALGQPSGVSAAMAATAGSNGAILIVIIVTAVLFAVIDSGVAAILPAGSTVALLVQIALQWTFSVIGVSVLTTIYGHYVEGRPLV